MIGLTRIYYFKEGISGVLDVEPRDAARVRQQLMASGAVITHTAQI
jgi:hypothetical protein